MDRTHFVIRVCLNKKMGLVDDVEDFGESGHLKYIGDVVCHVAKNEFAASGTYLLLKDKEKTESCTADVGETLKVEFDFLIGILEEGLHTLFEEWGCGGIDTACYGSKDFVFLDINT